MSSKSTKKQKNKKISGDLKSKKSIEKLKKKMRNVADEKLSAEQKILKLKEKNGKKSKLKKLKELLKQVLKKEMKIASRLNESEKSKKEAKPKKEKKSKAIVHDKKTDKISVEQTASGVDFHSASVITNPIQSEESKGKAPNHSSVDQRAKEAITHVRKLKDVQDIDLYVLGEKRSTVLKAAKSRKNRLAKP